MSKKQLNWLYVFAGIVIIVTMVYLLKAVLHEPLRPDTSDSLEVLKNIARKSADLNKDKAQTEYEEYEKHTYLPVDSAKRDSLGAAIERKAKADSIRRSAIRQRL